MEEAGEHPCWEEDGETRAQSEFHCWIGGQQKARSFSAQPLGSLLLHGSCASSLSDQGIKVTFGFSCCHTALHIEDKQKPELVCDCISSR